MEPIFYFAVARQPDIVNTALVTNKAVTHSITIMAIDNTIFETGNFAISAITNTNSFSCASDNFQALQANGEDSLPTPLSTYCMSLCIDRLILLPTQLLSSSYTIAGDALTLIMLFFS